MPGSRLKPILEASPTSRAKCVVCRDTIEKGHLRYGIPEHHHRNPVTIQRYYHKNCIADDMKNHLKDLQVTVRDHTPRQQARTRNVVTDRKGLRKQLNSLRTHLADEHGYEPYIVFTNRTLNDLMNKLPTTTAELMKVYGIKAQKCRRFGAPILDIIRQHKHRREEQPNPINKNLGPEFVASTNIGGDSSSLPEADATFSAPEPQVQQDDHPDWVPELVSSSGKHV